MCKGNAEQVEISGWGRKSWKRYWYDFPVEGERAGSATGEIFRWGKIFREAVSESSAVWAIVAGTMY